MQQNKKQNQPNTSQQPDRWIVTYEDIKRTDARGRIVTELIYLPIHFWLEDKQSEQGQEARTVIHFAVKC